MLFVLYVYISILCHSISPIIYDINRPHLMASYNYFLYMVSYLKYDIIYLFPLYHKHQMDIYSISYSDLFLVSVYWFFIV